MSNNRLWKRKLQDKIDEHNHRHGRKPKGVSNKTMHERATSLFRAFGLLRRLGYQLDPNGLAGRHIQVLVDYWTCNVRVADLCHQHGVDMLGRAHSTAYIQQQLSFLRVYANAWIGKPGMVHPLGDYVDDPVRFTRSYAATKDRSWEGNEVEFDSVVEKVGAIDQRVAAQLALLLAFGLRAQGRAHVHAACRRCVSRECPRLTASGRSLRGLSQDRARHQRRPLAPCGHSQR